MPDASPPPDDTAVLADRLRKAYQQLDRIAELARTVHRAAVPADLPDLPPLRFGVGHRSRPRGTVFDAWPAGPGAVTAFLAHAAGHGGTAELIGLLVRQAAAVEDLRSAGATSPGELLGRVNRLLLGLGLPDPPLVTMALARIDRESGRLAVARAAVPPVVFVPADGAVQAWPGPAPLLGVFDAEFETREGCLRPGDKILLTGDGDGLPAADRHRRLTAGPFAAAVAAELPEADGATVLVIERVA